MGRAAIGAITGGLPGALMGYSAATRADKNRDDRDPTKGLLGRSFRGDSSDESRSEGTAEDTLYGMSGMGGESGEVSNTATALDALANVDAAAAADVDPCPEGYVLDLETSTCVIDPFQIPFSDAVDSGTGPSTPLSPYTSANPETRLPTLSPVQQYSYAVPTSATQPLTMGRQGLASLQTRMG